MRGKAVTESLAKRPVAEAGAPLRSTTVPFPGVVRVGSYESVKGRKCCSWMIIMVLGYHKMRLASSKSPERVKPRNARLKRSYESLRCENGWRSRCFGRGRLVVAGAALHPGTTAMVLVGACHGDVNDEQGRSREETKRTIEPAAGLTGINWQRSRRRGVPAPCAPTFFLRAGIPSPRESPV
jgi:hypothetical protein